MIMIKNGMLAVAGTMEETMVETTLILHSVYKKLVEDVGEEDANKMLAKIGQAATVDFDSLGFDEMHIFDM